MLSEFLFLIWFGLKAIVLIINKIQEQMIREINILATGVSPKFEHLFSSKKHKIFRAYQRQTTQTYLTKIIIAKDQTVFNLYKQHILNNILPYLVSIKYLNHSSLLSLQPEVGQAMVKTQYQQQNDQSFNYEGNKGGKNNQTFMRKQKDSVTIILSKKMIKGNTLRQMILNKDERLNEDFCYDLIGQIIDFLLMGNGVKDMFITTQNIIVEDTGLIHFNYFSFAGLQFIKQEKYITKVQFEQLLPYLTPSLMKNQKQIDVQVELRFILINFISAYFKKDIIFAPGHYSLEVQVKRDKLLLEVVSNVTYNLLPNILSPAEKNKLQNHRTNIINLVNAFLKEKKGLQKTQKQGQNSKQLQNKQVYIKQTVSCTWQYILKNLSTFQPKVSSQHQMITQNSQEQMNLKNKQLINKRCKAKIKNFVNLLNINEKSNCVFIASALHNAVDIFIDVVDSIMQNENLKLKNVAKILKIKDHLFYERKNLIQRSRYSQSLYIPIKTGMRFSSILKYRNWVMMLQQSNSATQTTIDGAFNLLKFILDIRQTMTEIGSYISTNLLQSIIQNKTIKNIQMTNRLSQDFTLLNLLASFNTNQHLRRWFWQIFFIITNKIILLIKNFYLRVTAFQSVQKIKINQQDFSQILQIFKQFIPSLPQPKEQTLPIKHSSLKKSSQLISDV